MEEITGILVQIWALMNEMSPYLLLGFLLAGIMHVFVPGNLYSRFLSKGDFRSVLYAALFGIPLPLCSCGVIPTAMSLRKEGASKGATVSFLIATPQTGVDSIIATLSLMGLPFAVIRPVAALFTAVMGGQLVNVVERTRQEVKADTNVSPTDSALGQSKLGLAGKVREALKYAFLEMMEDIGKWLVVGLVVAGLITILVPDSFFAIFKGDTLLSMLLVLCIAVPMYICATGSIPIAVALMLKGLTPGSALVLLMAGPACNVASMLVVNKVLGRRTLLTYLASIITGSILFGIFIDHCLPADWFMPALMHTEACCHGGHASWFSSVCTVFLLLLLLNALWHRLRGHAHCHCHDGHSCSCHQTTGVDTPQTSNAVSTKPCVLTFGIKGMNCNHCRANAQKALLSIPGVISADVDLASARAQVEGDITLAQAEEALAALGFTLVS